MSLYQRVAYIKPNGNDEVLPTTTAGPLPAGLFIPPMTFNYNTYAGPGAYTLQQQGLVAMMAHDAQSPYGLYANAGFRVVTKPDGTMDAIPFMEAVAALCSYGVADEALSHNDKLLTARLRPLEMRCGYVTDFVNTCGAALGLQVRKMHLLNVTAMNNFDDGHVITEAKIDNVWRAFDVPNDLAWLDEFGELMPLHAIITKGVANCDKRLLARHRSGRSDYNIFPSCMHVFYELTFGTDALLDAWLSRVYEVPGISVSGGGIVWGLSPALWAYKSAIEGYPGAVNWQVVPLADWITTYY